MKKGDNIGVVHNTSIVPLVRGTSEAEGVLLQESYHLPLFEGTPPNLGGEFNRLGQQLYYYQFLFLETILYYSL
jgi:hypothetical protein